MCLAAVSVPVTVTLELELLSSEEEEEEEEEDSGVAAGGGSWLTGGRGGGGIVGLEGRGEDGWMTDSSSSSSWATDMTTGADGCSCLSLCGCSSSRGSSVLPHG